MASLKVLHSVGMASPISALLLNLEATLLEGQFQKQRSHGQKKITLRIGQGSYYGSVGGFPGTVEGRRKLFKKWMLEVVENDLGKTPLRLPESWDPHPACCGH